MKTNRRHFFEIFLAGVGFVVLVIVVLPALEKSQPEPASLTRAGFDVDSVMRKEEQTAPGSIKPEIPERYPFVRSEMAYPGFTLFPEVGSAKIKLLNMDGEVVHEWPFDADRARLLPNGNLIVVHGSKWGASVRKWRELNTVVREYDWHGELVWEHRVPQRVHHDVQVLENGNVVSLQRLDLPPVITESFKHPLLKGVEVRSDEVFEVNRSNTIVWSWLAHEHLDTGSCGKYECSAEMHERAATSSKPYDWTHINSVSVLPENQWWSQGDNRFRPGNIVIMPRNMSTVLIIDRNSGDIVWEYQGSYRGGLEYGHEPHMIAPGLPGAGNILVFDNGAFREESVVLEINPSTQEVVWKYEDGPRFFSRVQGSAQRLPNGNTLISEDVTPRVIEVAPDGTLVWQRAGDTMRIARASRYAPDFAPQFAELPLG